MSSKKHKHHARSANEGQAHSFETGAAPVETAKAVDDVSAHRNSQVIEATAVVSQPGLEQVSDVEAATTPPVLEPAAPVDLAVTEPQMAMPAQPSNQVEAVIAPVTPVTVGNLQMDVLDLQKETLRIVQFHMGQMFDFGTRLMQARTLPDVLEVQEDMVRQAQIIVQAQVKSFGQVATTLLGEGPLKGFLSLSLSNIGKQPYESKTT